MYKNADGRIIMVYSYKNDSTIATSKNTRKSHKHNVVQKRQRENNIYHITPFIKKFKTGKTKAELRTVSR